MTRQKINWKVGPSPPELKTIPVVPRRVLRSGQMLAADLVNTLERYYPSPEWYTTFWMMTIYSDTLHWSGMTLFLLIWTLLPNLTFYLMARGFHRTFATGAACQHRKLTPPDTWSCPTLGLASVLMLIPISPELVLSPDFWVSNIPRYFCFCSEVKRTSLLFSCA